MGFISRKYPRKFLGLQLFADLQGAGLCRVWRPESFYSSQMVGGASGPLS